MENRELRDRGPSEPAFRGSLAESPLPQILRLIFLEQLRGTLTLSRGDEVRRLFFDKGELRCAVSSREGQRLGSFLKRRGRITDENLTRVLSPGVRLPGSRLGQTLVEQGLLPRTVLDVEIKRLIEEIVFSAFEWESGDYRFDPSDSPLDPRIAVPLSTASIIVEGIRRVPESPRFREWLGDGKGVLHLAQDPMSRYQLLALTPQEAYLLSRIDGFLDVDALIALAGGSRSASAKTLYALVSCGLVEWKSDHSPHRDSAGDLKSLNVELSGEPPRSTPGHADLIRNTWRRLDWLSHYDLLGVPRDAGTEEIRRAYLDQSRLFHPDLRHRADLAGFSKELTAVFERLKVAHETLADPGFRAEYDRELEETAEPVEIERVSDHDARCELAARNFERAQQFIEEKDYFPAVELLQEAVRFAPDKPEYRFRLGEVELKNLNWIERAIENLREAVKLAPARGDFLRGTARALRLAGRREEAETYARRASEVDPCAESALLLAEFGAQEGDPAAGRTGKLFSRLLRRKRE